MQFSIRFGVYGLQARKNTKSNGEICKTGRYNIY